MRLLFKKMKKTELDNQLLNYPALFFIFNLCLFDSKDIQESGYIKNLHNAIVYTDEFH